MEQQTQDIVSGLSSKFPEWAIKWMPMAIILVSIGMIYGRVLGFEFVTYDDYDLIYNNTAYLGKISNVADAFRTPGLNVGHGTRMYYRPIQVISHIIDYQVWGLNAFGFHLTSLLLHALTTIILYQLLCLIIGDHLWSFIVSLLFALHPIQTEAVAWISGRVDVLLAFFIVLMMLFYVRTRKKIGHNRINVAMTILFFVAALFSKEPAIPYLLLIPLYEVSRGEVKLQRIFTRQNTGIFFVMGIVILIYGVIRMNIFGDVIGTKNTFDISQTLKRIETVPAVLAEHLALLCAPFRLSVAHPLNDLIWVRSPWSWIAFVFFLLIVAGLWWSWKKDRLIFLGLGWLAITLFPMLNIVPIAVPVMEHRLYLPMVGFAIAFTRGIFILLRAIRLERLGAIVMFVLVAVSAAISYSRLSVWTNSAMLWEDAIEKAPTSSRSYFNLAGYYFEHQQFDKTIDLMKTYMRLNPNDQMGLIKLRQSYFAANRIVDAAQVSRSLIPFHPMDPNGYIETAELYLEASLPESAIVVCNAGLAAVPRSFLLHDMLGHAYSQLQNDTLAEGHYKEALTMNPDYAASRIGLGILYARRGDRADAIASIEAGMKYSRPPDDVVRLLYQLYLESNQNQKAETLRNDYNFR
jgi:tetratricopeptide (TPR) repeat protein